MKGSGRGGSEREKEGEGEWRGRKGRREGKERQVVCFEIMGSVVHSAVSEMRVQSRQYDRMFALHSNVSCCSTSTGSGPGSRHQKNIGMRKRTTPALQCRNGARLRSHSSWSRLRSVGCTDRMNTSIKKSGGKKRGKQTRSLQITAHQCNDFRRFHSMLVGGVASIIISLGAGTYIGGAHDTEAYAADTVKIGTCLLRSCTVSLAKCIADVPCLENLACLQTCTGRPDEGDCQVRCADLYGDKAVDKFNTCAVSEEQCVPSRPDDGSYPVPDDSVLVKSFDPSILNGRWFIVAGLNPTFDTFPCQEHFFKGTPAIGGEPGKLYGKLNWRIPKPDGTFINRDTVQEFVQDPQKPAILSNHDNEFLHYEDDWYILGYAPEKYVFVYYRGNNDAWRGYGGAVVYSPERTIPPEVLDNIRTDAQKVNLDFDKQFTITDNKCEALQPRKTMRAQLAGELKEEAGMLEKAVDAEIQQLERNLEKVGRTGGRFIQKEEKIIEKGLVNEERALEATIQRDKRRIIDELKAMEAATQKLNGGVTRLFRFK